MEKFCIFSIDGQDIYIVSLRRQNAVRDFQRDDFFLRNDLFFLSRKTANWKTSRSRGVAISYSSIPRACCVGVLFGCANGARREAPCWNSRRGEEMVRVNHPPPLFPSFALTPTQRVPKGFPKGDYFSSSQSSSVIKKKWRLQQYEWTKESRSALIPSAVGVGPFSSYEIYTR